MTQLFSNELMLTSAKNVITGVVCASIQFESSIPQSRSIPWHNLYAANPLDPGNQIKPPRAEMFAPRTTMFIVDPERTKDCAAWHSQLRT